MATSSKVVPREVLWFIEAEVSTTKTKFTIVFGEGLCVVLGGYFDLKRFGLREREHVLSPFIMAPYLELLWGAANFSTPPRCTTYHVTWHRPHHASEQNLPLGEGQGKTKKEIHYTLPSPVRIYLDFRFSTHALMLLYIFYFSFVLRNVADWEKIAFKTRGFSCLEIKSLPKHLTTILLWKDLGVKWNISWLFALKNICDSKECFKPVFQVPSPKKRKFFIMNLGDIIEKLLSFTLITFFGIMLQRYLLYGMSTSSFQSWTSSLSLSVSYPIPQRTESIASLLQDRPDQSKFWIFICQKIWQGHERAYQSWEVVNDKFGHTSWVNLKTIPWGVPCCKLPWQATRYVA